MGMIYEGRGIGDGLKCTWCSRDLNWSNHAGESVCTGCHDLLSNAGIQPAEIFTDPERSKDRVSARS